MHTPDNLDLRLGAVIPFHDVDGIPNAIWTYELDWSRTAKRRNVFSLVWADVPRLRLGLRLSRRILIQDPKRFSDFRHVQDTKLLVPARGSVQYVFVEVDPTSDDPCAFTFIAPAQQDDFTPVMLAHQPAFETPWSDLPFKVSADGDSALQQVVTGPAIVCSCKTGRGLPAA